MDAAGLQRGRLTALLLTGTQTTSDLHDMISTATRGISWDARTLGPDVALDITVGRATTSPCTRTT